MINDLALTNFRNYPERHFEFSAQNVLLGPNGVGKTNVLEAIHLLSLTTSWRTERDTEVVRWETPFTRVVSGVHELVIQASPYLKRLRIDGVGKRTGEVIGRLPTVLFQPDDMQLLYGSPSYRRHYLDRVITQASPTYTKAILSLVHILRQRNRLLKNIKEGKATREELVFWNTQMVEVHQVTQPARAEFLIYIDSQLNTVFQEMVPDSPAVHVHYSQSPHQVESGFLKHLQLNQEKEIAAGASLYGPHREDLHFKWGEHSAEQALSRGQARALLIALKLAELNYLTERTETPPILLLDDIFSELDKERRRRLFQVLGEYQVIITTTDLDELGAKAKKDFAIIEL